jgi:Kef-type K+ transport system membrane component KefB
MQALITYFFQFILIALASWQIGKFFKSKGLPVITGYLFTGVVAGPFVLGVGTEEMGHALFFLEELSLAFISFAAGSELYLPELRSRFRSIGWITAGIVVLTFGLITTAVFLLANAIPFMQEMSTNTRLAVALLAGAIMTARSPSSAIAIVNELRAKGPYTQTILGVTVVSDVVVITIFAVTASLASVLLTDQGIEIGFFLLLLLELSLAGVVGYLLYHVICAILALEVGQSVKAFLIVMAGYGTFVLLHFVREYTHDVLPFEIFIEPLLVCLTASFLVNNYGKRRMEFTKILHDTGPFVYVLFFTLVGALLELPVFLQTWPIALALFLVRLIAIIGGSFAGLNRFFIFLWKIKIHDTKNSILISAHRAKRYFNFIFYRFGALCQ